MLDWYETVFELIDMRSFSNLWFWIALAVMWSTNSHWVLGVPYDLVTRARRQGGDSEADLHDAVRINVNRIIYIAEVSGMWIIGIGAFCLTGMGLLGFVYRLEFAQALFLLSFPMAVVFGLSVRTSHQIRAADGEGLYERLHRHRFITQVVGMISIFITALWGMWQNMQIGPL